MKYFDTKERRTFFVIGIRLIVYNEFGYSVIVVAVNFCVEFRFQNQANEDKNRNYYICIVFI